MNKKTILIIILIIFILIMGVYIYGIQKDLTLNDYFDKNGDYTSHWNNTSKQLKVEKEFPLKFNQTYKNVTTEITFYKDSVVIGDAVVVNNTHDGKLIINTTTKLSEEPNNIDFNIYDGELIDSDIEGLEYSRNFHLF